MTGNNAYKIAVSSSLGKFEVHIRSKGFNMCFICDV